MTALIKIKQVFKLFNQALEQARIIPFEFRLILCFEKKNELTIKKKTTPYFELKDFAGSKIKNAISKRKLNLALTDYTINFPNYIFKIFKKKRQTLIIALSVKRSEHAHLANYLIDTIFKFLNKNIIFYDTLFIDFMCQIAAVQIIKKNLSISESLALFLFVQFNKIDHQFYEEKKTTGNLAVITEKNVLTHEQEIISLKKIVGYEDIRGIRKLIEVSSDTFLLLGNEKGVYGLIQSSFVQEKNFIFSFLSTGGWLLTHHDSILFKVDANTVRAYQPKLDWSEFSGKAKKVFSEITADQINFLFDLLEQVINQPSGTNILITNQAEALVQRLKSQCTLITPKQLNHELIRSITRVDGTVVLDPSGVCFGFGAILDGNAAIHGDPARGGRYNSARMFCENASAPAMIIVISQDKTIDIVTSS